MLRVRSPDTYGRALTLCAILLLAASVFLPNGSYKGAGGLVSINALSAPFFDYGITELGVGVVAVLSVAAVWVRRRRPHQSALGTFIVFAGVLGLLLPDLWLRTTLTLTAGATSRTVPVTLALGFWLNLSTVLVIVLISSVAMLSQPRQLL